jgi:hypothetical protein
MITLENSIHLFLIIPILIYIGICIIIDKQNKYLGILFMIAFMLLIILHTSKIIKVSKNLFDEEPFEPSVGVFLLFFAGFMLFSTLYIK